MADQANRDSVTKYGEISGVEPCFAVTSSRTHPGMLRPMEPSPRPTFSPAGAGGLLVATTAATIGLGSLIGWTAGRWAYGALGGAVVGVPAGVAAVYRTYGDAFR